MKAAQVTAYGETDTVIVGENVPDPVPKPGQVFATVKAASFNPFDASVRKGLMQKMIPIPLPYIPGGDFAGVTTDGREVFGTAIVVSGGSGAFAGFTAANEANIAPKPARASFEEAAAMPLVATSSITALEENMKLQPGQKILIHGGAGGIGHIAIQLAKSMGAWVTTTVRTKDIDFVNTLGADEVIDFTKDDFSKKLRDLDAVYDTVGGEVTVKSFIVLKKGGVLVSMKGPPDAALSSQYGVTGIGQNTKQTTEHLTRVAQLFDSGKFKVHIDKTFPLTDVVTAWRFVEAGGIQGKVVLTI